MRLNKLGKTDIVVSQLCFGTLTFSPLQANLPNDQVAQLMIYAQQSGVNFYDTADLYDNYDKLAHGLKAVDKYNTVIASKSYAYDKKTANQTVDKALKVLERDYIDIWLMHEQESIHTMRGHEEALNCYVKMKQCGKIRAIGVSTHFVQGVEAALQYSDIEVIHPIYNLRGIGIQGGSKEEMLTAIQKADQRGIGIYGMKVFGGGHLLNDRISAMQHMLSLNCFDSLAIGMRSMAEIDYNRRFIETGQVDERLEKNTHYHDKKLMIHDWCTRCGACIKACQHGALSYDDVADCIAIDHLRCVKCGYCSQYCPDFCIKVV